MKDLISSRNDSEVENLIIKYRNVLEASNLLTEKEIKLMAIIMEIAINYIEKKYNNIDADIKTWCIILLKHLLKKIKTENEIFKHIDNFISFWNEEYDNYVNSIIMSTSKYEKDYVFLLGFLDTK